VATFAVPVLTHPTLGQEIRPPIGAPQADLDNLAPVWADATLKRIGMAVDRQSMDRDTVIQCRADWQPFDHGGWLMSCALISDSGPGQPAVDAGQGTVRLAE
jgi:hypothetical protein